MEVKVFPHATSVEWKGFKYEMFVGVREGLVTIVVLDSDADHFFEVRFDKSRLGKIKKSALILAKKIIGRPIREVMLG